MQPTSNPDVATCPSCGALMDVSAEDPFALVNCSSCGAQMRVRKEFASFEVQGILGEGGQGTVFRAVDKKLNRPVAIKLMKRELSANPDFVKRFEAEAQITASLNHPNIVKVFSFGEHRKLLYLAMEIVDYGSLEGLIAHVKTVPEDHALDVGIQIAHGLKAGLDRGLIHRDIKPGNILFSDGNTAKIVDFGLAILLEKQHEESGDVWATPYYVAPEKLDGRPEDFRSDMYSLAATLFHAIAGRPPFLAETDSMSKLREIKSRPVHLRSFAPEISTATAYVIDKAMSAEPADRFQSYDEFIENLEYARNELHKHRQAGLAPQADPEVVRPTANAWLSFGVIAVIVATCVYFWVSRPDPLTRGNQAGSPAAATPKPPQSVEAIFDEGRSQLVEGRFKMAAATFHTLYEEGRLPEPKNSWAAVHEGLAEYFAGRPGAARKAFKTLDERIQPGTIGLDAGLVSLMTWLAAVGSDEEPAQLRDLERFNKSTTDALAYLVLGVKKWDEGSVDDGAVLLREFVSATPDEESAWIADYRPLATRLLAEHAAFRDIAEALAKVDEAPEAAEAALARLTDMKRTFTSAPLVRSLAKIETESAPKVAAAVAAAKAAMAAKQAAIARQQAEDLAKEEKALTVAKFQVRDLCENYRFNEARAVIRAVEVKHEQLVAERDILARRIDWLVQFKQHLIEDLNTGTYTMPIVRKNGLQLIGGVKRATDQQMEIRVQFGSLPIAWSDLSAQTILQMAKAYMRPTLPPAAVADKKWEAGVFCMFAQLFNEGQLLMEEAANLKEEHRTNRALFFGQPAPDVPKEPAPPPSVPGKPADPMPSSGTELSGSSLTLDPDKGEPGMRKIPGLPDPP